MDSLANLTRAACVAGSAPVRARQAIFTSIRSPMGTGYRIVAESPGLAVEDKREITRQSPSHGSLLDESAAARGLAAYPLPRGGHAIALSHPAGAEHTARGGDRVQTRIVVLERGDFRRFHCDPVRIESAIRAMVGDDDLAKPPDRLAELSISTDRADFRSGLPFDEGKLAHLAGAILDGGNVIVVGAPGPRPVFAAALSLLPAVVRDSTSVSFGLKPSPSRRYQVVFCDAMPANLPRGNGDTANVVFDWSDEPPAPPGEFQAWLEFGQACEADGIGDHFEQLCMELTGSMSTEHLAQLASLHATWLDEGLSATEAATPESPRQ